MANIFSEIEEYILFNEDIAFDEEKIKNYISKIILDKFDSYEKEKGFLFEEIIYSFFEYQNIPLIKTPKTRDFGIDGIIKLKTDLIGSIDIGLQVKNRIIDSTDVDSFLSSLNNSELRLGLIICKESRRLDKYELNSKIKAILLSKGIRVKERLINESVSINPIAIMKFGEIVSIIASEIRLIVKGVYKK